MESEVLASESSNGALAPLEKLESRIQQTIDELREARRGQNAASGEVTQLRESLAEKERQIETLMAELQKREEERRHVRERIERLLAQVEQLSES